LKNVTPREFEFHDMAMLAASLATTVVSDLQSALTAGRRASLIVPGGKTPAAFMDALSAAHLDWSAVDVSLTDERWVDVEHPDSNEALVRDHLLRGPAAAAHMVGLKTSAATPDQGEAECEARLSALARPFDVTILGMGEDGHTASLIPGAPKLSAALAPDSGRLCMSINSMAPQGLRMTLTLPALLASRRIIILFAGAGKHDVYRQALETGPIAALPVSYILHQAKFSVDVYWSH
jgi:6-phosphogluconolactonase